MSQVSCDSTWNENRGVIYQSNNGDFESDKISNREHETVNKEIHLNVEKIGSNNDRRSKRNRIDILETNNLIQKERTNFRNTSGEQFCKQWKQQTVNKLTKCSDKKTNKGIYGKNDDYGETKSTKYAKKLSKYNIKCRELIKTVETEGNRNEKLEEYKKTRHKDDQRSQSLKIGAGHELKRNNCSNARTRWSWNSRVLISLVMLNVAGQSCAEDTSSFAPGLTTRMLASFLGYPSTCSWGGSVRPCSLTVSCWLRGGTALAGCGGWLFSCCGTKEPNTDEQSNSISSSDWQYKPPPKLRVPQRTMPNNVFRRRVDDDVTQVDCGLPSSRILQKRIIGGREARFAEFPWQAHVRISEFQCGGVLVARRYVATAAHCVSRAHTRDIAVWLGAIDTSATHHPARKLGVIQKILHPLFQFRMTQPDRYDIALLKLSRPITYMAHILPICLPDYDMDLRGRSGVIAGWGKTDASNGHTGTNLLRSATVPILSKEQCINWHQSKQISVEIHSEMICAGHSDGHQDACLGDSGGPLIVLDNGRYYLVGITSAGFGCGVDHQPGIYHNVKLTANWIRNVIAPSVNYNDNYLK